MLRRMAAATLVATTIASAQDDWVATIEKAHDHHRYAVRRAVSNKIAQAGDAAVPAIQTFVNKRGLNAVSLLLVDAIARSDGDGAKTIALLGEWSDTREFFWRSQALGGLAGRGLAAFEPRFEQALDDVSHLFRIQGARGLVKLGGDARYAKVATMLSGETDPRARLRIASFLVEVGKFDALEQVVAALGRDSLSFLGDAWGEREAELAVKTIQAAAGEDFGWRDARLDADSRLAAFERMRAWASEKCGREIELERLRDPSGHTSGFEVRSCRNGDLFLRWGAGGITVGLEGRRRLELPAATVREIAKHLGAISIDGVRGKVICDFLRLRDDTGAKHVKIAPGELPMSETAWLETLVRSVEAAGDADLAAAIRTRQTQFLEAADRDN